MNPFRFSRSSRTDSEDRDGKAEAILLVDADDAYVRGMTRTLRSLGYPFVFRARSVSEALDLLKRICPTVLLSEWGTEGLLSACSELGASVAIVSGEVARDSAAIGVRVLGKADLSDERLERLVYDLVAENRAQRRESARPLRSLSGRTEVVRGTSLKSA